MTALIAAQDARKVSSFAGPRPPAEPAVHPLEAECERLRAELSAAKEAIADLREASERAVETARERGQREGIKQAEDREAARLAALETALGDAVQLFDRKLAGLDRLAAELASVALARMLDEPDTLAQWSSAFIAQQVRALKDAGIIRVRVSHDDFRDEASIALLAARLRSGRSELDIVCDPAIERGQARLECALGQADLDLARQWRALATLLRDMAGE
jgi:flagellar biosynthesis/type III secretory pathway protein FliH